MDEMTQAGVACIAIGLPCVLVGVLVATGKFPSHSAAAARDPARARLAEGMLLIAINAALVLMGLAFLVVPELMTKTVTGWLVTGVVVGSVLGLIPVFRAHRT
ncbi:hypothetical protein [Arenimonas terrae]|uniref:Uncharacterized protein n=1 Tax=Arenimonas terrae TaxID=2546226 RepID=A0A5C4RTK2_9GAMM|nr:hypothetical protein [Arenimonas terrae]TNJ34358.1 hypothetical protein E1B00_00770 [Arenimonas terrae]